MLQKQTYVVRHKTTRRALICSYGRHFCECPCELTLGRETKTEISCEWNTKFSIIPEIPLKRVHSKRIPKFSKTFTGIFTVPFSFGPEISEILVEWKAPRISDPTRIIPRRHVVEIRKKYLKLTPLFTRFSLKVIST